ncbi:PLP-dependent aminotransferase family protein [Streptomyces sp. NPDC046881]|uniref:aminotransferase-like domain-containing protein n=1 Tax=Streptomyces sp. NPDC046881 TaxID=3155374 RepID=UPI0033F78B52
MDTGFVAALGDWRDRPGPLARTLAAAVRDAVVDGRLPAGTRLPSERELARTLRLSRGTVVTALGLLRADGWLHTRHGSGSAVRLPARLTERTTPWSLDRGGAPDADLDLTLAVTAAPHEAYRAALARAVERSAPLLVDSGVATAGLPRLRELIADRYTRAGLATRPEQILVTAGAQAALTLLLDHLHTDRRAPVVVENPAYPGALAVLRARRARLLPVPVSAQAGWDLEHLAAAVRRHRPRLAYLVPDFHNPTGAHMDPAARRTLAALADRHRLTVLADETMRDLDLRTPPGTEPHLAGARVVQIGSASKTLWSGLRVGWIRATADLVRHLQLTPLQAQLSPPPLEQLIAAELLGAPLPALLADRRARLRAQRDHLAALLAGTGWTYTVPAGGLTLWLRLGDAGPHATDLAARAAARGLAITPGPRFAADRTTLARHLRLPFTATPETLTRVVGLLRECWTP